MEGQFQYHHKHTHLVITPTHDGSIIISIESTMDGETLDIVLPSDEMRHLCDYLIRETSR